LEGYSTIRDLLGSLIGKTLVDVSQHDQEDWELEGESFVVLMFSDGSSVKFYTGERAFDIDGPAADNGDQNG
jgi:hypothetical protein